MKNSPDRPSSRSRPLCHGLWSALLWTAVLLAPGCNREPLKAWTPDQRLTDHLGISLLSLNNAHCLAAQGDTLQVVWEDLREAVEGVYFLRSTDGSATWKAEARLSPSGFRSRHPSLVVSGTNTYVVWDESQGDSGLVRFRRSPDRGGIWDTVCALSAKGLSVGSPSLAASEPVLHAVWEDSVKGARRIRYRRSPDQGTTWEPETCLTPKKAWARSPAIAAEGSKVQAVWMDSLPGNWEIASIRSSDGGTTWGLPVRLTQDSGRSQNPTLARGGDLVLILWEEARTSGQPRIFLKRSTDGGETWKPDAALNELRHAATFPALSLSGKTVHVAWNAWVTGNNDEIFYKRSLDGGKTWEPDLRLTWNSQYSSFPSLAASGPGVHVVWSDYRDANREIYHKADPKGNFPPGKNLLRVLWDHPASQVALVVLFIAAILVGILLTVKLILLASKEPSAGGKEKEASPAKKKAVGKPPAQRSAEADKRFHEGTEFLTQGKWAEAERALREALKLFPEDPLAYLRLGAALEEQGKEDRAEAAYRKAVWLAPGDPEAHFRLGGLLEKQALVLGQADHREPHAFPDGSVAQKKYHEAEWECHEALRLKPDYLEALKRIAGLLDLQERSREARRYWERALPLETDPGEKQSILKRLIVQEEALEEV